MFLQQLIPIDSRRIHYAVGLIVAFYLLCGSLLPSDNPDIEVEGQAVCIDQSGKAVELTYDCSVRSHLFGFLTDQKQLLYFTDEDPRAKIFRDPHAWARDYRLKGRKKSGSEIEIIHLHAVENGELLELYYRCDVCNITAFGPGLCWCCQEEFEFREKVIGGSSKAKR